MYLETSHSRHFDRGTKSNDEQTNDKTNKKVKAKKKKKEK